VQKTVSLVFDSCYHTGMTMPRSAYGNASREIQEFIAVDILYPETLSLIGHEGVHTRI
jgi:hypothetical protein